MAISQRTKLTLKDVGAPQQLLALPEDKRTRLLLGTLAGQATGFCERKNPKDDTEKFEGLTGQFRTIPADEKAEMLESGVLFIPDAFHNMIAEPLRKSKASDVNAKLDFIFDIYVIGAKNAAGYSWEFKPRIEASAANPLDALLAGHGELKVVEGRRVLALAAPEKPAAKK